MLFFAFNVELDHQSTCRPFQFSLVNQLSQTDHYNIELPSYTNSQYISNVCSLTVRPTILLSTVYYSIEVTKYNYYKSHINSIATQDYPNGIFVVADHSGCAV
jgi:hypothetical protein